MLNIVCPNCLSWQDVDLDKNIIIQTRHSIIIFQFLTVFCALDTLLFCYLNSVKIPNESTCFFCLVMLLKYVQTFGKILNSVHAVLIRVRPRPNPLSLLEATPPIYRDMVPFLFGISQSIGHLVLELGQQRPFRQLDDH